MLPRTLTLLVALAACGGVSRAVRQGDAYLDGGHPDAAVRAYTEALERRPDDPALHLKLARARLASDDASLALPPARIAAQAGEAGARLVLGRALLETGQRDEAFTVARAELEEAPSPAASALLGEIELSRGQPARAATWLGRAGEDAGPEPLALYAWALALSGEVGQAREAAVAASSSTSAEARLIVAATWLYLGQSADAEGLGAALRAEDPRALQPGGLKEARAASAARRRAWGDHPGALLDGLGALALDPEDARLCWVVGTWLLSDGDPGRAVAWLERALSLPPYAIDPTARVAVASSDGPDLSVISAERVEIARALAEAWRALGDHARAARALEVAILEAPGPVSAEGYLALSDAYLAAGRRAEAGAMATRAADLGHPEATLRVARALAAQGQLDAAIARATAAWGQAPGDKQLALLLAELHLARMEPGPAERALRQALARAPGDPELSAALASVKAATAAPDLDALIGPRR